MIPEDKVKHALAGSILASAGFCLGFIAGLPVGLAAIGGVGAATLVGLAKELVDKAGYGTPDVADFLVTLGGGIAAALVILALI